MNDFETLTVPLAPGEFTEPPIDLQPTPMLVGRGHRIRMAVAGYDEGTFVRIPAEGTRVVTMAQNRPHASYIGLPVASRS